VEILSSTEINATALSHVTVYKSLQMKLKRKIKIASGIIIALIVFWQFGFFYRFNYFTAKIDCWRDSACIVTTESPRYPCGVSCIGLKEQYGFHEAAVGCVLTGSEIRGIDAYNSEIETYLNKRNGANWQKKYEAELDSLIKYNRVE